MGSRGHSFCFEYAVFLSCSLNVLGFVSWLNAFYCNGTQDKHKLCVRLFFFVGFVNSFVFGKFLYGSTLCLNRALHGLPEKIMMFRAWMNIPTSNYKLLFASSSFCCMCLLIWVAFFWV